MDRFPPPHPIYPPVIHYGPAPIPLRKEPHIPLTPKTGMRREEIERRLSEIDVTPEEKAAWNAKYAKPSTGIPKTDLASSVQASLDKADTALQEHQSLSGYATEEWVGEQGFLTQHQDITGKVDKSALFDNPDTNPMVKSALLPSYVDDVLEYDSLSAFPATGETGKIYVALDTNKTYRWTGTQYVQVGGDEQAQADWAQTDSDAPDFIKNKPTIPAAQVNADWNASSGAAQILNKPTIPTVPTNVSAFANDAGYLTQHQSLSAYRTATAQDAIDGALEAAIAAKYTKPASGIPAGDLASAVQSALSDSRTPTEHAGTHHSVDGSDPLDGTVLNVGGSGSYSGTSIATAIDDLNTTVAGKADASSLADVATTGDYDDLTNKPTIPAAQVNADWNAASGVAQILNKPTIPDVSGKASSAAIAPAFSTSSTYAVGDYVTHEGLLYKCTTAVSTAGAWDSTKWTAVSAMGEMPAPVSVPNRKVWAAIGSYTSQTVYQATTASGDFALSDGAVVIMNCPISNNANPTLNVDGTGDKSIRGSRKYYGADDVPAGAMQTGGIYVFQCYKRDNAYWWILLGSFYAPLSSPAFTGTPTAPTAPAGTNTTQIATTAFVQGEIRYAFASPTPTVSGTSATVACEDRAINDFTVATGITSLTITPPAAVTGRARDFFCRVTLTDSSLPTVTLSGATIDIGATEVAGMTQGVNLLMFTEIASGHWLVSVREAEA